MIFEYSAVVFRFVFEFIPIPISAGLLLTQISVTQQAKILIVASSWIVVIPEHSPGTAVDCHQQVISCGDNEDILHQLLPLCSL